MSYQLLNEVGSLREFFQAGHTLSYEFRIAALRKLRQAIYDHEEDINKALFEDLHKNKEEVWITETGYVISELNNSIKNLRKWMRPARKKTNLLNFPSSSFVLREPLGIVLIIAPWNYPFQLLLSPLVGAIAAGNCVVLKSSEHAPATSAVTSKIIASCFSPSHVMLAEGDGSIVVPALMNGFAFNHVFYTGSTEVGRLIYKMAADKLIPVTLELGGKSPCVVEADADIDVAAKRIVMTKFSNAGQMCVAPDYVLVHESRKAELLNAFKKYIPAFFGDNPKENEGYGRIINQRQWDRLDGYLKTAHIAQGGKRDKQDLYIEPTILDQVLPGDGCMQQEIFGPLLPVIGFTTTSEAQGWIAEHPDPLAFYIFTRSRATQDLWLQNTRFGGGCVNNAALHFTNHALPFGGRGSSGIGKYHGKNSFDTFSHAKGIMRTPGWFDPAIKYPPFKGRLKLLKWLIR